MTPSIEEVGWRLVNALAALPVARQEEGALLTIGWALEQLPSEKVAELRADIAAAYPDNLTIVAQVLDLIDGHLALRKLKDSK